MLLLLINYKLNLFVPFAEISIIKMMKLSKRSKHVTHFHSSCNSSHNRFERRGPHCIDRNINDSDIMIAVTDNTSYSCII
jgi:hypothetical protein